MEVDAVGKIYFTGKSSTQDLRPNSYAEVEDNIVCAEKAEGIKYSSNILDSNCFSLSVI